MLLRISNLAVIYSPSCFAVEIQTYTPFKRTETKGMWMEIARLWNIVANEQEVVLF
jgi:hypothetical protein